MSAFQDIEAKNHDGDTPIESTTDHDMFKMLVLLGAELNNRDVDGNSKLISSQLNPNDVSSKNLRLRDANASSDVKKFDTPLQNLRLAVRHGLDFNMRNKRGHNFLIHYAIREFEGEHVEDLVNLGFNVNERDPYGITALTHAARGGFIEKAKKLISFGAIGDEMTLEWAFKNYGGTSYAEARKLHENNQKQQSLHFMDDDWNGLLLIAAKKNKAGEIDHLIRNGHDTEDKNIVGMTPLLIASYYGHVEVVNLLFQHGADLSARTYPKPNPCGTIRTVEHVDVQYIDAVPHKTGEYTSLMFAAMRGHLETCELLVQIGVEIDETSGGGFTALSLAVIYNHPPIVSFLLKMGADTAVKDVDGRTPLMWASTLKYTELTDILITQGAVIDVISSAKISSEQESLASTLSRAYTSMGRCPHVDLIRTSSGHCVHITSMLAKRTMMRMLNNEVNPFNITAPKQTTATCWFFTSVAMLFISDLARNNSKSIRRNMIMGVNGVKNRTPFNREIKKTMLRFNMMIQSIIDGDAQEEESSQITPMSVFRNNEEIVSQLFEHFSIDYPKMKQIWCGSNPKIAMQSLIEVLGTEEDEMKDLRRNVFQANIECDDLQGRKMIMAPFDEEAARNGMRRVICNRMYVVDSMSIMYKSHVVAAVTIGGEYYLMDSLRPLLKVRWPMVFEHDEEDLEEGGYVGPYVFHKEVGEIMLTRRSTQVFYQLLSNQPVL